MLTCVQHQTDSTAGVISIGLEYDLFHSGDLSAMRAKLSHAPPTSHSDKGVMWRCISDPLSDRTAFRACKVDLQIHRVVSLPNVQTA